jgi:hypothetical protein
VRHPEPEPRPLAAYYTGDVQGTQSAGSELSQSNVHASTGASQKLSHLPKKLDLEIAIRQVACKGFDFRGAHECSLTGDRSDGGIENVKAGWVVRPWSRTQRVQRPMSSSRTGSVVVPALRSSSDRSFSQCAILLPFLATNLPNSLSRPF